MEFKELFGHFVKSGKVKFIGIRPGRRAPIQPISEVFAKEQSGLKGDRYNTQAGARQVTLIQEEHLDVVASVLGKLTIDPKDVRRNIVVSGINLIALKGKQFQIGEAVLEYSGECQPCSRMEENLGVGGYNAMLGHGGITARILKSGLIKIGDDLSPIL